MTDYEQPPAPVREFIDSPHYLNLADETFPVIKDTLQELFAGPYTEAAIAWGIGSGKSYFSALAVCYMLHRALCLRDPQRHYGLAPGSPIVFMNMGLNALQARRVVFDNIREKVQKSPWFESHHPVKAFATELRFPKNILVIAGNSAETYPLGFNILGAVLDEASWYPEDMEGRRDVAEEIYNALQRRIRSRFLDRGLLVMISSPRYEDDFLQRKIAEAKWNERVFASRRPTWEVKPRRFYSGDTFEREGVTIPVEYRDDFRRDARRALRDIASQPVAAVCPFFDDPEALERCIDEGRQHPVDDGGSLRPGFRATDNEPRFVHVDLGLKRDACGLAMAHLEPTKASSGSSIPARQPSRRTGVSPVNSSRRSSIPAPHLTRGSSFPARHFPRGSSFQLDNPNGPRGSSIPARHFPRRSSFPARHAGEAGSSPHPPDPPSGSSILARHASCRLSPDDSRLTVVLDYMERIQPPPGGELSFADIRQRIYDLRGRGFNIVKVTFDNWQSVDSRQILAQRGFETEALSVDRTLDAYETLRSLVSAGAVSFYRYEPFLRECRRLEFIKGARVDHPPGGSKDVADAVAAAALSALRSAPATIGGGIL